MSSLAVVQAVAAGAFIFIFGCMAIDKYVLAKRFKDAE